MKRSSNESLPQLFFPVKGYDLSTETFNQGAAFKTECDLILTWLEESLYEVDLLTEVGKCPAMTPYNLVVVENVKMIVIGEDLTLTLKVYHPEAEVTFLIDEDRLGKSK